MLTRCGPACGGQTSCADGMNAASMADTDPKAAPASSAAPAPTNDATIAEKSAAPAPINDATHAEIIKSAVGIANAEKMNASAIDIADAEKVAPADVNVADAEKMASAVDIADAAAVDPPCSCDPRVRSLLAALPCTCEKCAAASSSLTTSLPSASEAAASRFLTVCGHDVAKAAHVLTTSLIWRASFGVDALMAEPQEITEGRAQAVSPVFPMGVHSRRSRRGHAIYILRAGYAVPSAGRAPDVFRGEDGAQAWLRYHVHCNERCLAASEQKLVVWDLHNLSRAQLLDPDSLRLIARLVKIDVRNYPLTLHKCLLVNSPAWLHTLWPAIAAMLDEQSLRRVRVLGRVEEAEVKAALREEVDDDDLPVYLGGRYDGPTPLGLALAADGGGGSGGAADAGGAGAGSGWYDYLFGS